MKLILKYFPDLTEDQKYKFKMLKDIYEDWNTKINVISRKDIDQLYLKHILHSLSISKVISFINGTTILDVGTGGGFPGIPLAILFPRCNFVLLDSIAKKIKVVDAAVLSLKLNNVSTITDRVENTSIKYDFIVSRAVTKMKDFKRLIKGKVNNTSNNTLNNGILYLKGGDLKNELLGINHKKFNISDFFDEEFFNTKKIIYVNY
ncbi:MAG: 16S rRNA (guanine(527)-N(7))-methyltransferase RsmG [Flavobacteriales bacterium]|jgi:16S rRNA (guanine527-N7)-methyltransferase|nr:16S rRNA (guanine(527)-N(7))-methyltransferase RsmG [Flavobacteriales bacterium]